MDARRAQSLIGLGVVLLALALAWGALGIRSEAGYGGVGPNFLPWVVAAALAVLGVVLLVHARTTGFRDMEEPEGSATGDWLRFGWVSAGLLANAALIDVAGFVLSCALCYWLAVRGFRLAQGQGVGNPRGWLIDVLVGLAIAAPVFWMFGLGLGIQLPGLTKTGWL